MLSMRRISQAASILVFLLVFLFGTQAMAASYSWNTTNAINTEWNNPANWGDGTGSTYPGSGDDVIIVGGLNLVSITILSNVSIASLSVSGNVEFISNATLTVTGATTIGAGTLYLDYVSNFTTTAGPTILAMNTLTLTTNGKIANSRSTWTQPVRISVGGFVTMDDVKTGWIEYGIRTQITQTRMLFASHVRFDGDLEFPVTTNRLFSLAYSNLYLGKRANLIISPTDGAGYIATISDNNNDSSLVGRLCKEYDATHLGPFTFPVGAEGNSDKYVPISVEIKNVYRGSWGVPSDSPHPFPHVSVRVVAEKHPMNAQTSGSFNLYWVVDGVGAPDSLCLDVWMTYHNNYRTGSPAPLYSARFTQSYESTTANNSNGVWDLGGSQVSTSGGSVRWVQMGPCVPDFGDFTIAIEGSALPVELVSFSARYMNKNVELKWQTATELNNYGFAIERSIDGASWSEVDFVPGAGNSSSPRNYAWIDMLDDELRSHPKLAYRLLQMDRDGTTEYSNIVNVSLGQTPSAVQLHEAYPNPFNPSTTINFTLPDSRIAAVRVFNIYGAVVATVLEETELGAGVHTMSFHGDKLPSGSYIVVLRAGDIVRHQRIVLSK